MSLWTCSNTACGCRFAVGLFRCPQCGTVSPQFAKEEEMAKITVGGGVSNADALPGEPGYIEPPVPEASAAEAASSTPATPPAEPPAGSAADPSAPPAEAPERPAANAPKADWRTYQLARGLTPEQADDMTKAALQAWEPDAEG